MLPMMHQTCPQLGARVVRNGTGKSLARDAVEDILGNLKASRCVELHNFVVEIELMPVRYSAPGKVRNFTEDFD
jgi:hypothetical protein